MFISSRDQPPLGGLRSAPAGLGEKLRRDLSQTWTLMAHVPPQGLSPPPHHTQTMARALPGKAKAVWSAKSRCLWRQSPTMFGHHLRLLCGVVDANHSQRPWAFPQWRRVMPSTSKGTGPSHHGQWWKGPHCERRPKAKRNHSANSTGRSRLPLDGKGGAFTYRRLLLRDDALWRGP